MRDCHELFLRVQTQIEVDVMLASASIRPALNARVKTRPHLQRLGPKQSFASPRATPVEVLLALGEVGDVEAPTGAIFIAAAIATVAVLLVPFGTTAIRHGPYLTFSISLAHFPPFSHQD